MAKRQKQLMIVAVIVIVLLVIFMSFRKSERYKPGDTKFFKSDLPTPEEATFIQPGDIEKGKKYSTPNGEYYFMLRQDGELVWAKEGGEVLWFLGTEGSGENATARFLKNGDICVAGTKISKCADSGKKDVPEGQHLLILKNDGRMYIDTGRGRPETHQFYPYD
jgi:hypothetical protein